MAVLSVATEGATLKVVCRGALSERCQAEGFQVDATVYLQGDLEYSLSPDGSVDPTIEARIVHLIASEEAPVADLDPYADFSPDVPALPGSAGEPEAAAESGYEEDYEAVDPSYDYEEPFEPECSFEGTDAYLLAYGEEESDDEDTHAIQYFDDDGSLIGEQDIWVDWPSVAGEDGDLWWDRDCSSDPE